MLQEHGPYGPDRSRLPTWSWRVLATAAVVDVAIVLTARSAPLVLRVVRIAYYLFGSLHLVAVSCGPVVAWVLAVASCPTTGCEVMVQMPGAFKPCNQWLECCAVQYALAVVALVYSARSLLW